VAESNAIEPDSTIPFNRPSIEGDELTYIQRSILEGHSAAKGPYSIRAASTLRGALGAADVLLTTSCTSALELSALLLDLTPRDTVIVPSFTFVTTALAFVRTGAGLLFADIEPDTLGLDPESVAGLLDPSVRAVVPVHYAGVGCDLDGLFAVLADRPDVTVVEDNAHGLFGSYHGRPLGSFGRFSALSFHETKNFICGEGGALVLNDPADIDRAHRLYDKGTNRRAFLLGEIDKYSWVDTGSSFGMADILAAYLLAQLEAKESILAKRAAVSRGYRELLEPHADELGIELMHVPPDRLESYHMFYVLVRDRATRDRALQDLKEHQIHPTFHYVPLHSAPAASRFFARPTACPIAEDLSGRLLRLPFFNSLAPDQIERVVDRLIESLRSRRGC